MIVASYIYIGQFAPADVNQLWAKPESGGRVSLHVFSDGGWKVVGEGDGKSAYELAVERGYSGTLDEWLDSLKGESLTYDKLTSEQKAELAQDAVAAANRAALAAETIEAAIKDLDPSQSADDAVVALAARQGVLENNLDKLGPKIDQIEDAVNGSDAKTLDISGESWTRGRTDENLVISALASVFYALKYDVSDWRGGTISFYGYGYNGFILDDDSVEATNLDTQAEYQALQTWDIPSNAKYAVICYATSLIPATQSVVLHKDATSGLNDSIERVANSVATEENARASADNAISNRVNVLENAASGIIRGLNLMDMSHFVDGTNIDVYLNPSTGVASANNGWFTSDFIDISDRSVSILQWYKYDNNPSYFRSGRVYVFYNENKTYISGGALGGNTSSLGTPISIPDGAYFVRVSDSWTKNVVNKYMLIYGNDVFNGYKPYTSVTVQSNRQLTEGALRIGANRWVGKRVLVLGDSISDVNYHYANNEKWDKWPQVLSNKYGFTLDIDAILATGFIAYASDSTTNLISRLSAHDNDTYDMIVLFMGINDSIKGIPIGTEPTADKTADFYSAVEWCLNHIVTTHPTARFLGVLPLPMGSSPSQSSDSYVNVLKERYEYYRVPYLDLRKHGGFRPYIDEFNDAFCEQGGDGNADRLHPNQTWDNNYLAPMIGDFMSRFVL